MTLVLPTQRENTKLPEEGSVRVLSDEDIQATDDHQLIHLIWDTFGVAVDYKTPRNDVLKTLRKLAS